MSAISGASKQGQKSCPKPPELLSLDTSGDIAVEHEIGGNPSSRRPPKTQQKWALMHQNLLTFTRL